MNVKLQQLVNRGIVSLHKNQPKGEHIEVYVDGDINDGDCVNSTATLSIDEFIKDLPLWTKATNEYDGYIDDVKDKELRTFLRDISPSSPVDDCDVHTIDQIDFTYHDGLGNSFPFTLKTPQDARDFLITDILETNVSN